MGHLTHFVTGERLAEPWPPGARIARFGMGCFWGVERLFWQQTGVLVTMVGYGGGHSSNPTYEQVCGKETGHVELVQLAYDPNIISFDQLLSLFWTNHDPTQGDRQGNDRGPQYRSAIFAENKDEMEQALASREAYQKRLSTAGYGPITTEIALHKNFYLAEDYHQQYLAKNPLGYCALHGTGVHFDI